MGCSFSTNTSVQPLKSGKLNGDKDETGSKVDGRGDSAASKGTADSGVMMETRETPALPGGVQREVPPLICIRGNGMDRFQQDGIRPEASAILEELLNEGIIPEGQRDGTAGPAFSIMLDDGEGVRRKPPARLESLKANKTQSFTREEVDEKIRLAEKRRKLKEDELTTRLRAKSARVRGPAHTSASSADVDGNATLTPVEQLHLPLEADTLNPSLYSRFTREEAEGEENARENAGDGRRSSEETGIAERKEGGQEGRKSGEGTDRASEGEDGDEEEEVTQVEEGKENQLFVALEELDNDSSLQGDREEEF